MQSRRTLHAGQPVPTQVHDVRRHCLLIRTALLHPPASGLRNHTDHAVSVEHRHGRVEAGAFESLGKDRRNRLSGIIQQRLIATRQAGVARNNGESLRVFLHISQQCQHRLFDAVTRASQGQRFPNRGLQGLHLLVDDCLVEPLFGTEMLVDNRL